MLRDAHISECSAEIGGCIAAKDKSNVAISGDTALEECSASENGGGVAATSTSSLEMNDAARITESTAVRGGGVYAEASSSIVMRGSSSIDDNEAGLFGGGVFGTVNCTVRMFDQARVYANEADDQGGGITLTIQSSLYLRGNSSIDDNTADECGGGVLLEDDSEERSAFFYMHDYSTIANNRAEEGGGVCLSGSSSYAHFTDDSTIKNNQAEDGSGGGLYVHGAYIDLTERAQIRDNVAAGSGGGLKLEEDAAYLRTGPETSIQGNVAGGYGGAVFVVEGSGTFEGSFMHNQAYRSGGIHASRGNLRMNCYFGFNSAQTAAGAIGADVGTSVVLGGKTLVEYNTAGSDAGGLYLYDSASRVMTTSDFNEGEEEDEDEDEDEEDEDEDEEEEDEDEKEGEEDRRLEETDEEDEDEVQDDEDEDEDEIALNSTFVRFRHNVASEGSGGCILFGELGSFDISGFIFQGCVARDYGGAVAITRTQYGGGLALMAEGTLLLEDSELENNMASVSGGATVTDNKAMYGPIIASNIAALEITSESGVEASGKVLNSPIVIEARDAEGQVVVSLDGGDTVVEISPVEEGALMDGDSKLSFVMGVATTSQNTRFIYKPDTTVTISAVSTELRTEVRLALRACQPGEIMSTDETTCETCTAFHYYDDSGEIGKCSECIDGMVCELETPIEERLLSTVRVDKKYWRARVDSTEIEKCYQEENCPGGVGSGDALCGAHAKDTLCNVCERGYYLTWTGKCSECSGIESMIILSILLFIAAIAVALLVRKTLRARERAHAENTEKLMSHFEHLKWWVTTLLFLWLSMQFIVIFTRVEKIVFPSPYGSVLSIFAFMTEFGLVSVCTSNLFSYYNYVAAYALVSIVVAIFVSLAYLAHQARIALRTDGKVSHDEKAARSLAEDDTGEMLQKYRSSFVYFMLLFYTPICVTLIEYFNCDGPYEKASDDPARRVSSHYVVASQYSISCDSDMYKAFRPFVFVMLLLHVVALPLGCVVYLWHAGVILRERSALNALVSRYASQYWYWEAVVVGVRIVCCGGQLLIIGNQKLRLAISVITANMYLYLCAECKPLRNQVDHGQVFQLCNVNVALAVTVGAIFKLGELSSDNNLKLSSSLAFIYGLTIVQMYRASRAAVLTTLVETIHDMELFDSDEFCRFYNQGGSVAATLASAVEVAIDKIMKSSSVNGANHNACWLYFTKYLCPITAYWNDTTPLVSVLRAHERWIISRWADSSASSKKLEYVFGPIAHYFEKALVEAHIQDVEALPVESIVALATTSSTTVTNFERLRMIAFTRNDEIRLAMLTCTENILDNPGGSELLKIDNFAREDDIRHAALSPETSDLWGALAKLSADDTFLEALDTEVFPSLIHQVSAFAYEPFVQLVRHLVPDLEAVEDLKPTTTKATIMPSAPKLNDDVALALPAMESDNTDDAHDGSLFVCKPDIALKLTNRLRAKVEELQLEKGSDQRPHCAHVTDALRASIVCHDAVTFLNTWKALSNDPSGKLRIVRLKNKVKAKIIPFNFHINCVVDTDIMSVPILVELQIWFSQVRTLSKKQHHLYELMRAAAITDIH
ncbi:hypothetical protein CTAYLR_010411 [Chrysophaeum taylorii]|uniref:Right handed beta helix domain-containing protein n=1 Tax=Chrysophaeum taylorii TaxID=2483200 RepID=A0AAD7UHF0_9STRA|nr:hypothetical protein CTAYLR_010411 [Chrysophaeum taylorii]